MFHHVRPIFPRQLVSSIQKRTLHYSPIAMTGIIDTIKADHREIESYYNQILQASNADEQTRYQNQFTWELARHSIAEELVVYPAMERYITGGDKMADKDRQEHQKVNTPNPNPIFYLAKQRKGQRTVEEIPKHET